MKEFLEFITDSHRLDWADALECRRRWGPQIRAWLSSARLPKLQPPQKVADDYLKQIQSETVIAGSLVGAASIPLLLAMLPLFQPSVLAAVGTIIGRCLAHKYYTSFGSFYARAAKRQDHGLFLLETDAWKKRH